MSGMNPGVVVSKIENTRPCPGGMPTDMSHASVMMPSAARSLNDRNADAEHERDREHVPERV